MRTGTAAIPTFASRWLIPRMADFRVKHPGISVDLSTRAEPFMFNDTPFDAAIHFGDPIWPVRTNTCLARKWFRSAVLTCSRVGFRSSRKNSPGWSCCTSPHRSDAWRQWFEMAGVTGVNVMGGARYELFFFTLIPAAQAGLGVALVPRFFVQKKIASGELVSPCPFALRSQRGLLTGVSGEPRRIGYRCSANGCMNRPRPIARLKSGKGAECGFSGLCPEAAAYQQHFSLRFPRGGEQTDILSNALQPSTMESVLFR